MKNNRRDARSGALKAGEVKRRLPVETKGRRQPPTPPKAAEVPLRTALDVRREMATVYRSVKSGSTDSQHGSRLVYILSQIGRMIELHEVEARLSALEAKKGASGNA